MISQNLEISTRIIMGSFGDGYKVPTSVVCVYFPKSYTYEKVLKFAGRTTLSWSLDEEFGYYHLWIYNPKLQAEFDETELD